MHASDVFGIMIAGTRALASLDIIYRIRDAVLLTNYYLVMKLFGVFAQFMGAFGAEFS